MQSESPEILDTRVLVPRPFLKKLSLWLAVASCLAILLSIAVSQILLAVALGVLLLSGLPLRWPRVVKMTIGISVSFLPCC